MHDEMSSLEYRSASSADGDASSSRRRTKKKRRDERENETRSRALSLSFTSSCRNASSEKSVPRIVDTNHESDPKCPREGSKARRDVGSKSIFHPMRCTMQRTRVPERRPRASLRLLEIPMGYSFPRKSLPRILLTPSPPFRSTFDSPTVPNRRDEGKPWGSQSLETCPFAAEDTMTVLRRILVKEGHAIRVSWNGASESFGCQSTRRGRFPKEEPQDGRPYPRQSFDGDLSKTHLAFPIKRNETGRDDPKHDEDILDCWHGHVCSTPSGCNRRE